MLDFLACPVCKSSLRLNDNELLCTGCGRGYSVVDGIPVLLAERAILHQECE